MRRRTVVLAVVAALVVAAAVQGAHLIGWLGGAPGEDEIVVTADFADTTGLYVGNDVTYLGVRVGEVVEVEPRGTVMRVVMHLEPDVELPEDAGAQILQSSLVTDRYLELGPAYKGGPTLASGTHIDADHTRSPATVDEIARAIDDLVLAMDAGLGDARNDQGLGRLLSVSADALRGNGDAIREALGSSRTALETLNAKEESIAAVVSGLTRLTDVVAERDRVIRTFSGTTAATARVLADQREELVATLDSLDQLTGMTTELLRENGDVLADDLARLDEVVGIVRRHQGSLEEAFDVMPTLAENYARAYDWDLERLRVQFSVRAGPFSSVFRDQLCREFAHLGGAEGLCALLFRPDGSGLLDGLFDGAYDGLPGGFP